MNKHDIQKAKDKYKQFKFKLIHGEYDAVVAVGMMIAIAYITVAVTTLIMKG